MALLASLSVTLVAIPLLPYLDHANIVMLFLLAVIGIAAGYGRGPAVLMAILNVLSFNFVFVPPHFAFAFETLQSIVTFVVMLIVGLVVGQLTARFRYQAHIARRGEERAQFLYEMACELSGALATEQIIAISERYVEASFEVRAQLLLPDDQDQLQAPRTQLSKLDAELSRAQWCFDHATPITPAAAANSSEPALLYLALKAPLRTRGVLVIAADHQPLALIPEQRRLLDTLAAMIAIALERVHLASIASDTLVKIEAERERNTLLAGLSHDLRTPMTALMGLAETLALEWSREQSPYQESLASIREQAERMMLLVNNLLDMARLQEGRIQLHKDWQSVEELVGSAIRTLEQPLCNHPLRLSLPSELPLIYCDAVLIERVLINLLQNAAQYTPSGTVIGINAQTQIDYLHIEIWDEGQGLPKTRSQDLFEKFTRGQMEPTVAGVGLGLSICRAIIDAHGGQIQANNRLMGGACFEFTLPLQPLPPLEMIEDEAFMESG